MDKQCKRCKEIKYDYEFYMNGNLNCKDCHKILRKIKKFCKMSYEEKIFNLIQLYSKGKTLELLSEYFECKIDELKLWIKENNINHNSKKCGKCLKIKTITDFSSGQQNPSGWCKFCVNFYNSDYYKNNENVLKENASDYYYNNYEKCRKQQKIYYNENYEEKIKIVQKIWRDNNRNLITEYNDFYYKENKESLIEYQYNYRQENRALSNFWKAKYRSSKKQAIPKWVNFDKIKEIYDLSTKLTKETGILHHVDHIIPLQHDLVCGLHVEDNLQILTAEENIKKSNKFEPIFGL